MKMDAARFYALLRFEEASLALRAVMRMRLVDEIGNDNLSHSALREKFGFTEQAARTFFALLQVMEILQHTEDGHSVTPLAAECLADGVASSRKPYLSMGTGDDVDAFIDLLRGKHPDDALPLYSGEDAGETVMDNTDVAVVTRQKLRPATCCGGGHKSSQRKDTGRCWRGFTLRSPRLSERNARTAESHAGGSRERDAVCP